MEPFDLSRLPLSTQRDVSPSIRNPRMNRPPNTTLLTSARSPDGDCVPRMGIAFPGLGLRSLYGYCVSRTYPSTHWPGRREATGLVTPRVAYRLKLQR